VKKKSTSWDAQCAGKCSTSEAWTKQFVAQDLQGFGHPRQFVSGQKAHDEAWFGGISDPACSSGCRFGVR
jgi:hypothetical protein